MLNKRPQHALHMDMQDIPVIGQVVDENYNVLQIRTMWFEVEDSGLTNLIEAIEGARIRVLSYSAYFEGSQKFFFNSTESGQITSTKGASLIVDSISGAYLFQTGIGEGLQISCESSSRVSIDLVYVEVPDDSVGS